MRILTILSILVLLSGCKWEPFELRSLPGATSSIAHDINDEGVIVGTSTVAGSSRATLWASYTARPIDLGTLGGAQSVALGINNNGKVVGWSEIGRRDAYNNPIRRAFVWVPDFMLAAWGNVESGDFSSVAYATNDSDWVAGESGYQAVFSRGLLYPLYPPEDVESRRGVTSVARDINQHNQIAGYFSSWEEIFLWDSGSYSRPLQQNIAGRPVSQRGLGMNDEGDIVGRATFIEPFPTSATLATYVPNSGAAKWLDDFYWSQANDVNNFNWVVGHSKNSANTTVSFPFIWFPNEDEPFSEQLDAIAGAGLPGSAWAINDEGKIVGLSQRPDGSMRATYWEIREEDD